MDAIKTRIPQYTGHADMLPVFCQSICNVRDAFGPESEKWIINSLISKLKGPAATGFASRLTQYENIESLLRDLKTQYWGREGADSLKTKLQTIQQDATESAASFCLRVQGLHNSLMNALDQDPNISKSHRKILKEIAVKEACEQFLCGLRPELEVATRAKQPTTLSTAIDSAVAHEGTRGLRDSIKSSTPQTNSNQANVRLTTSEKAENLPQTVNNLKFDISCDFCKKPGHELIECRTLRRKILNEHSNKTFSPANIRDRLINNSNKPFNMRNKSFENNNFRSPSTSLFRRNNIRQFNNRNDLPRRFRFNDEQAQSFRNNNRPDGRTQQSNNSRQFYNTGQSNNRNYKNYNRNNTRQNFYDNNDKRPNIRRNF